MNKSRLEYILIVSVFNTAVKSLFVKLLTQVIGEQRK